MSRQKKPGDETTSIKPIRVTERERNAWKLAVAAGDTIPEGWRPSREWSAVWKIKKSKTLDVIASLLAKGKMQSRRFRVQYAGEHRLRSVLHYKLV